MVVIISAACNNYSNNDCFNSIGKKKYSTSIIDTDVVDGVNSNGSSVNHTYSDVLGSKYGSSTSSYKNANNSSIATLSDDFVSFDSPKKQQIQRKTTQRQHYTKGHKITTTSSSSSRYCDNKKIIPISKPYYMYLSKLGNKV